MNNILKKHFGYMDDGREISTYSLKNKNGMKVKITDFAGSIMQIKTPDRDGRFTDVVCGFDSADDYLNAKGCHGALIGRVGNRIAGARFTLDGKEYTLYDNKDGNSLHGGKVGFSHRLWDAEPIDGDEPQLVLTYVSPDGEENYPGTLKVKVTYTLTSDNALSIHYEAVTDKKTIVNMTNHAYFNLGGFASGSIENHTLKIDADAYLPTDEFLIPTGEIRPVDGTPFDFRDEKAIGADIHADNADIANGNGYDQCFVFRGGETKEPVLRAVLYDPKSGREMQVITNIDAMQVYTGNFMNGPEPFKGGCPQVPYHAVALETEKMPDAIHHDNFSDVTLDVGEKYDYITIYKFSVRK